MALDSPLPRTRRRGIALGSAVALLGGLTAGAFTVGPADAATPAKGTVSGTSRTVSYTSGPFTAANVTGTAGTVDCTVPGSCDDYTLTVSTPAGFGSNNSLKITSSWANSAADYDIYLLDSAGNEVGSSASSSDPEVIQVAPDAGTYTVRIVPFTPLADTVNTTVALVANPVDPPVSNAPASGFRNFPAPAALTDAHNAGEPSIGFDRKTNKALYQSYLSTYRVAFNDTSSGTTATYVNRSANASNGCAVGSTQSLDPILATDELTGRTIESQLLDLRGIGSLACVTGNDGDNWAISQGGGFNSGVDHQTLGWGPYAPGGNSPARTFPSELYYCSQDIALASCSTSQDGGITFGAAVPMYTLNKCGGLHGHVKVAPDGTAYVPNKSCGGHPAVVVSHDNGLTWAVRPVLGGTPGKSDPSVAIADDGTVYLSWNGANNHAYTAVSRDRGETWSTPYDVGKQLGIQAAVFPAAVAGDAKRAAVAFIGTKTGGDFQDGDDTDENGVFHGVWQLYVASTYDGGKTWKTSNATGTDPVQRGSICVGGTTCGDDRNLLDFIDATIDPQGRVLVGYADGCTAACRTTTAPTDSTAGYRDALATIARQSSGLRLHADADPLPDLKVSAIKVSRDANGVEHASALLSNIGKAAASGATVRFFDGCRPCGAKAIGTSTGVSLAPGASTRVTVTWSGATRGAHTVTAVADPARKIRESRESNNKCQAAVTVV